MESRRSTSRVAHRRGYRSLGALAIIVVLTLVAGACSLRLEASKPSPPVLIGAGGTNPSYLDDPQFARVLAQQFNSLSPENELKWSFNEPQRGVFDFTQLDELVAFARQHGMAVKGHGLISGCCNPDWLTAITDPVQLRAAMTTHFDTLMHRYAGTMDRWDVVTEPLSVFGGTGPEHNYFYNVLGPDYIAEAFEIAHAADPDATLFINESLVEFAPTKAQELHDLVADLVARGVPIDGVGLEMHETYTGPPPGVITDIVSSYQELGLEVAITELDVHLPHLADDGEYEQQAQIYRDIAEEALAAGVGDISFWGFTDKYTFTWIPGAKPHVFDESYNPKPAYWAVWGALHEHGIEPSAR